MRFLEYDLDQQKRSSRANLCLHVLHAYTSFVWKRCEKVENVFTSTLTLVQSVFFCMFDHKIDFCMTCRSLPNVTLTFIWPPRVLRWEGQTSFSSECTSKRFVYTFVIYLFFCLECFRVGISEELKELLRGYYFFYIILLFCRIPLPITFFLFTSSKSNHISSLTSNWKGGNMFWTQFVGG